MADDELGDKAEALVEAQIKASGWRYIADRQFSDNGAPMIRGDGDDDRIRPDFSVAKNGEQVWIESKGKTEAAEYEGTKRHGVDLYNWEEYNRVSELTGIPCWLFVYERTTGVLLCRDLSDLAVVDDRIKDKYGPNDPYGGPMVFFDRGQFHRKKIKASEYPTAFFGQNKLPLKNVTDEKDIPLFPKSELGESSDSPNRRIEEFIADGGDD